MDSTSTHPTADGPRTRAGAYDYWAALYNALATLDLPDERVRHDPEVIERLRSYGWATSPDTLDRYWHRIRWMADHCRGRVLEVGCGTGNVTRWIAATPEVTSVLGLDILPAYIENLRAFGWPKVTAACADARQAGVLDRHDPFDTVVLGEIVEHLPLHEEVSIVAAIRPHLAPGARWVISTPLNFMPDPDHVRGFGTRVFGWHAGLLYGRVEDRSSNLIQQYVACRDADRGRRAHAVAALIGPATAPTAFRLRALPGRLARTLSRSP